MIKQHQPTIFPDKLTVAVSSLEDGNMSFRVPGSIEEHPFADIWIKQNRQRFLGELGVKLTQAALVAVKYGPEEDYATYRQVGRLDGGKSMSTPEPTDTADGLVTNETDLALFLPLADCNGLVMYDPEHSALMVSHLGRHSTNVDGAQRSVGFMTQTFDSKPEDILAWISPGVGPSSYAMEAEPSQPGHYDFVGDRRWNGFRSVKGDKVYLDLPGYNRNGLIQAGIKPSNIEQSQVDTATDDGYPSHSQGDRARFAIVAMINSSKM